MCASREATRENVENDLFVAEFSFTHAKNPELSGIEVKFKSILFFWSIIFGGIGFHHSDCVNFVEIKARQFAKENVGSKSTKNY